MRSAEEILDQYRHRKVQYEDTHRKMHEVATVYNGKANIALPDMDRNEAASTPNLLQQGVDQMAGRIASVTAQSIFSSMQPGVRKYDRRARDASQTTTGWWQMDHLSEKMKVRARRFVAYASAPVVIRWNYEEQRPTWQVRHPLETYASADLIAGEVVPTDCIFSYTRTAGWLRANGYAEHLYKLTNKNKPIANDAIVTIVEYIDVDHSVIMATGHYGRWEMMQGGQGGGMKAVVLQNFPILGGVMPVVIPQRLSLDEQRGQFDGMLGMYYQQARLMALENIAIEKDIFPDTYLVGRQGETPKITDGPHDGRTGLINIVQGGDIKLVQGSPSYQTGQQADRLERSSRVTAGIPAEFGGESGNNIRTGRRGDAVLSAVIDSPLSEAQEVFAHSLEAENKAAIAQAKAVLGNSKVTIYVGTSNSRRPVTFAATETFEVSDHVVAYPVSGTDANQLILGVSQRVGLEIMSKETAAELDPFIVDPELERDRIVKEKIDEALLMGILQQASTGQLPPQAMVQIRLLVARDKMDIGDAIIKVSEDAAKAAQEAQSQQQQAQPQTAEQIGAPAAVGALTGGQPSIAPVDETMPGIANLGGMLGAIRQPGRTSVPMRNVSRGGM